MLLEDRNAVIYGAGGAIGGPVAAAFAREGARVHLAGRTQAPLDALAVRTTFLTARAAARHMVGKGSGVILAFGGSGEPMSVTRSAGRRLRSTPSSRCAGSSRASWGRTASTS